MSFRDLVPFRRQNRSSELTSPSDPFDSFHREIDRLFEDFWGGGPLMRSFGDRFERPAAMQMPKIEVSENDKAYLIEADLPGLSEEDIDVNLANGILTISGEKKREEEKKEKDVQYSERSYGSFKRTLQVPDNVQEDAIKAKFKNGVLHLELPKTAEEISKARRIEIQKS